MSTSNKGIAKAFKEARKYIASGQCKYICIALDQVYYDYKIETYWRDSAKRVIQARLADGTYGSGTGTDSLEGWLARNFNNIRAIDLLNHYTKEMKECRLRWLDSLIAEFS